MDRTELFVEFPPLAVGEKSPFAAHFTRLSDYGPVAERRVVVRLSGGGHPDETFEAGPAPTAGIFRPVAIPKYAGIRNLSFELTTPEFTSIHDIGEIRVYQSAGEASHALIDEGDEDSGLISLLKQTQ
jgi:hypothetical protein